MGSRDHEELQWITMSDWVERVRKEVGSSFPPLPSYYCSRQSDAFSQNGSSLHSMVNAGGSHAVIMGQYSDIKISQRYDCMESGWIGTSNRLPGRLRDPSTSTVDHPKSSS